MNKLAHDSNEKKGAPSLKWHSVQVHNMTRKPYQTTHRLNPSMNMVKAFEDGQKNRSQFLTEYEIQSMPNEG